MSFDSYFVYFKYKKMKCFIMNRNEVINSSIKYSINEVSSLEIESKVEVPSSKS